MLAIELPLLDEGLRRPDSSEKPLQIRSPYSAEREEKGRLGPLWGACWLVSLALEGDSTALSGFQGYEQLGKRWRIFHRLCALTALVYATCAGLGAIAEIDVIMAEPWTPRTPSQSTSSGIVYQTVLLVCEVLFLAELLTHELLYQIVALPNFKESQRMFWNAFDIALACLCVCRIVLGLSGKTGLLMSLLLVVVSFGRVAHVFRICNKAGAHSLASIVFNIWAGYLDMSGFYVCILFVVLKVVANSSGKPFNGIQVAALFSTLPLTCIRMGVNSLSKAGANYSAMLAVAHAREVLTTQLHKLYLNRAACSFVVNNLDKRLDSVDARIADDVGSFLQFFAEFALGGILKPETGLFYNVAKVLYVINLLLVQAKSKQSEAVTSLLGVSAAFLLTVFGAHFIAARLTEWQGRIQSAEASFRTAHMAARANAESIRFYGGERAERQELDRKLEQVGSAFKPYFHSKFWLDFSQLSYNFASQDFGALIAAKFVADYSEFNLVKGLIGKAFKALVEVTQNIMDLAKANGMIERVVQLFEVLEAFNLRANSSPITDYANDLLRLHPFGNPVLPDLEASIEVSSTDWGAIQMGLADVFTPDGSRLLLSQFSFELTPGSACQIMGPSGVGKSSILRVLAGIWPLFRTRSDTFLARPGHRNLFFLAQKPYLTTGSLIDQVIYPVWEDTVKSELTEEHFGELLDECGLSVMRQERWEQIHDTGIVWEDVLSLGEQQRLLFARLLWHFEWTAKHGEPGAPFFAVLDESTAAMDVEVECLVYKALRDRGIGILSVAHRPTVIQFHPKVLLLEEKNGLITYRIRDGAEMAREHADEVCESSPGEDGASKSQSASQEADVEAQDCSGVSSFGSNQNIDAANGEVVTPYSAAKEDSTELGIFACFVRIVKLAHARTRWTHLLLILCFLLVIVVFVSDFFGSLLSIQIQDKFKDGEMQAFWSLQILALCLKLFAALGKASKNLAAGFLMIAWRMNFVRRLHSMYMSPHGSLYYTLSNLDKRVDVAEQRITGETDMCFQYMFEFFAGGIHKPDSGALFNIMSMIGTSVFLVIVRDTTSKTNSVPIYVEGLTTLIYVFAVSVVSGLVANAVKRRQEHQQLCEGMFRKAHDRCRVNSEAIAFYRGEDAEFAIVDTCAQRLFESMRAFAWSKFLLECVTLFFRHSCMIVAAYVTALIAMGMGEDADGKQRSGLFFKAFPKFKEQMMLLVVVITQMLDLTKAAALVSRISKLYEVMEAFWIFSQKSLKSTGVLVSEYGEVQEHQHYCCSSYVVPEYPCGPLVQPSQHSSVNFSNLDIYTPNGQSCLLRKFSMKMEKGASCQIVGPSGVGKSSLLRVLAGLWPLFERRYSASRVGPYASMATAARQMLLRPEGHSIFFLGQRPYIFSGTLREQIAYPIWDDSLIGDLSDDVCQRLFEMCNLSDRWLLWKPLLDTEGLSWTSILSLGEQQRIQFCRLFWHFEKYTLGGGHPGDFLAVLDESISSMDVYSETVVYSQCVSSGMSFLSIAHRPTTLRFHQRVLQLIVEQGPTGEGRSKRLTYRNVPSKVVQQQAATQMVQFLP